MKSAMIALLLLSSPLFAQVQPSFNLDRVYQEIVKPLQDEIWQLRLYIIQLSEQNQSLLRENAKLSAENAKLSAEK